MIPRFLRPEVFPCASIEIVHVDNSVTIVRAPISRVERTIEETERAAFHTFLTNPTTGPLLDAMLADNAAIDAAPANLVRVPAPVVCAWCAVFNPAGGLVDGLCADCAARLEHDDQDARDEECGSQCSARCGYCGRCS